MTIASFQLQLYLLFFTMDVSKNFVANNFFPFAQKVRGKGQGGLGGVLPYLGLIGMYRRKKVWFLRVSILT